MALPLSFVVNLKHKTQRVLQKPLLLSSHSDHFFPLSAYSSPVLFKIQGDPGLKGSSGVRVYIRRRGKRHTKWWLSVHPVCVCHQSSEDMASPASVAGFELDHILGCA